MTLVVGLVVALLLLDYLFFNIITPSFSGVVVLMYHKVQPEYKDRSAVSLDDFEKHLAAIKRKGINSVFASEVETTPKGVCLTFDDGFLCCLEHVLPLLERYQVKATFFVVTAYPGAIPEWYEEPERLMTFEEMRQLAASPWVEIGLHGHRHLNYKQISLQEMEQDIASCKQVLSDNKVPYRNILAYPFGKYRRKDKDAEQFAMHEQVLNKLAIDLAFRIGNRKNAIPMKSQFEITRTEIRGDKGIFDFSIKLKKGRRSLF